MKNYTTRDDCRICGSKDLVKILDLGETPLANGFLTKDELGKTEEKFPLAVYFCKKCSLVQLLDVVDPKILFGKYHFITSASKPSVEHFAKFGKELRDKFVKSKDDLVIDIGGNDGTLLGNLKDCCRVLNIEPASNIAEISAGNGIPTINDFFSSGLAQKVLNKYGKASVISANNIIAHTDKVKDVFAGANLLLKDDGVFVFEAHWVKNLIGDGGFDQVYHEHLCYYSLHALKHLVESEGFFIKDVKSVPMQGESLRVYAGKTSGYSVSADEFLKKEKEMGLTNVGAYFGFSDKVVKNAKNVKKMLVDLKQQGKKVVGYGASAKGNTLLNYFGVGNDILDYIVDTTPLKQGLYSPGTHIPVVHPDKIKEDTPDYIFILAWNYADSIIEKESALREKGVKFIIPVPEVKIF